MKAFSLLVFFLLIANYSYSQTFTEQSLTISNNTAYDSRNARIEVADFNGDGLMDFLLIEDDGGQMKLFRNDGNYELDVVWTENSRSVTSWIDINDDNVLDLLVAGADETPGEYETIFYLGDGTSFIDGNISLPRISTGRPDWGDFDLDGDIDILLNSVSESNDGNGTVAPAFMNLYENNGQNSFQSTGFEIIDPSFPQRSSTFGDMDNDGDLDFWWVFESFFENVAGDYSGRFVGGGGVRNVIIADINADGLMDVMGSGNQFIEIWDNQGNNEFSYVNMDFDEDIVATALGDVNLDGRLDILINSETQTDILINQGDFTFTELDAGFTHAIDGTAQLIDIDADGDLDVLIAVTDTDTSFELKLYLNGATTTNLAPSVPEDLTFTSSTANDTIRLSWSASTDAITPQDAISYNVAIYDESDTLLSPMVNANGGVMRYRNGNSQLNAFYYIVGLPVGTYQWKVQAMDQTWLGSAFSDEATFQVLPTSTFNVEAVTACVQDTITVTYTGNASGNADYQWDFDGAEVISGTGQGPYELRWDGTGSYNVSLTVTESELSSTSTVTEVSVLYVPTSNIVSDAFYCFGDSLKIHYNGLAESNAFFEWSINDLDISHGRDSLAALSDTLKVFLDTPGAYEIELGIEDTGCSADTTFTVTLNEVLTSTFETSDLVCEGDESSVAFTGEAPASAAFSWNVADGELITDESSNDVTIAWSTFGEKEISLTLNEDGCQSTTTANVEYREQPTVTLSSVTSTCIDQEVTIQSSVTTSVTNYEWNFGNAEVVSGTEGGPYVLSWSEGGAKEVTLSASNGICSSEATSVTVTVPSSPIAPEICVVTVDSATNQNKILWSDDSAFDSVYIYRETNVSDEYDLIGVTSAQTSTFIDENSFPEEIASRYRLTRVDTCGFESPVSTIHKTMHLTINQGVGNSWNLIWDGYEGISFGSYSIYRGTSEASLSLLREVQSNLTSFTDTDAPEGDIFYQVRVILDTSCSSETESNGSREASRSNIANFIEEVLSTELEKTSFSISPNPASEYLTIKGAVGSANYEIFNLSGRVIQRGKIPVDGNISLMELRTGIYMLRIANSGYVSQQKFIKK